MGGIGLPLLVFAALVAAALVGVEAKKKILFGVTKPAATLSLLLLVKTGPVPSLLGWTIAAGIVLATIGDAILLSDKGGAFLGGLVLFLLAHGCYAMGFARGVTAASWQPGVVVGAVVILGASGWLVWRLWPGISARLRGPLVCYAGAISVMAGAAVLTLAGPWPARVSSAAAAGAVAFYVSDANLAWNRFRNSYPHGQTVTLSLYWAGQLGIALAARFGGEG